MIIERLARLINALYLAVFAVPAPVAACSPRLCYFNLSHWWSKRCAALYCDFEIEQRVLLTGYAALCCAPLFVRRCGRASAPVTDIGSGRVQLLTMPPSLSLAQFAYASMPFWTEPLVKSYGRAATLAVAVLRMVCTLLTVCFVSATAVGHDERGGRKPGTLALSWGLNLGGFPG